MQQVKSKTTYFMAFVGLCLVSKVTAWGGLFNRYNPAIMGDLGYTGGHGGYAKELFGASSAGEPNIVEELLEAEEAAVSTCSGKKCTANEHCCQDHVCIDDNELTGRCFPIWGKKQGEVCLRDTDCESGFVCADNGSRRRVCKAVVQGNAELGEDCRTSSDCDISRGLCCKLQRKARSRPKKICSYFSDSQTCIGPVSVNQVLSAVEHTAGEKRISGHPDDYLHFRK